MTAARDVDHVVIGLGGIGSAAAYWLARLGGEATAGRSGGARVVGLEQFALGHLNGASHDHSRIIRHSYHTPGYVALTTGAFAAWRSVEEDLGRPLLVRTGGIDVFPAGGVIPIEGYTTSMDAHGVPYEVIDAHEAMRRFPQFRLPVDATVLFQADTGIAPAALGTAAHQTLARRRGAELIDSTAVESISSDGAGEITIVTPVGAYRSGSVVICADAWTNELIASLGTTIRLEITREQVVYYPTPHFGDYAVGRFPVWIWMDDPCFYGFPLYGRADAVKAAEDVGGRPTTARTRSFDPDRESLGRLGRFLADVLPGIPHGAPQVTTCLYALTPDRDFVLDTLPGHPGLQVAVGAGHGFKFASWFGRTLAELMVGGATEWDLSAFRFDRPALTDPDFVANYMT